MTITLVFENVDDAARLDIGYIVKRYIEAVEGMSACKMFTTTTTADGKAHERMFYNIMRES